MKKIINVIAFLIVLLNVTQITVFAAHSKPYTEGASILNPVVNQETFELGYADNIKHHHVKLKKGEKITLYATDHVLGTQQWFSNDISVVTVDNKGNVCAVGEGNATIICNSLFATDIFDVTVRLSLWQKIVSFLSDFISFILSPFN